MDYNQPFGTVAGTGYTNGNPATGTAGSIPPAGSIEYPQREIVNAVTQSGQTPSNSDLLQLWKAMQIAARGHLVIFNVGTTSWVAPAGIVKVEVEVWGAGGGGGGATNAANSMASAGAGGGYGRGFFDVTPGNSYSVVVGAGGAGGLATIPTNGSSGGSSSFGALISATGGTAGFAANGTVQVTFAGVGGTSVGGQIIRPGTPGGNGYIVQPGAEWAQAPGGGAYTTGNGFVQVCGGANPGFAGYFPAGGGNGAGFAANGGAGGDGLILIKY